MLEYIGYKVVAVVLLLTVSVIAMFFDILPVLLAAVLSAIVWDFFFIPPRFTFSITSPDDLLLFLMYFVIAMINAALTYKIRQMEKEALKKEEKERTLRLYNTILNSLSHELRTPIATIIGATDNLQHENKLSDLNKHELLSEISTAALRLNYQVANLLNMSRIESGFYRPKKDWVDVSELIYGVLKRLEEHKIRQEILIDIQEQIPLHKLDKIMLEESLYNLLRNAILHTPDNAVISVEARHKQGWLELTVSDTGPGFPSDEIDKVFDKFYRLRNAKAEGTGLGLSIVKGFVEAQDGDIELQNLASGGAKFIIHIPAEISPMHE
jgi:two-component system sensor histidine kinase KdpD